MNRITYWYSGLSRKTKIAITAGGIALAVIIAAAVLYMVFKPTMVEVTYGTIVYDPVDGYVWENNTQTIWVEASEADNYKVERIEKLSEEHQAQIDAEKARQAAEDEQYGDATGVEPVAVAVPSDVMDDLRTLDQNLQSMSQDVITGLEMANEIKELRNSLQVHYDQVAAFAVIPEVEQYKQQYLTAIGKYIQAADIILQSISDPGSVDSNQAMILFEEANQILREIGDIIIGNLPSFE
jgi:hypothetical protein